MYQSIKLKVDIHASLQVGINNVTHLTRNGLNSNSKESFHFPFLTDNGDSMDQGHRIQQVTQVDKGPAEVDIGYSGRDRHRKRREKAVEGSVMRTGRSGKLIGEMKNVLEGENTKNEKQICEEKG